MEGDGYWSVRIDEQNHFNPLPPHGGRQFADVSRVQLLISIHSLRMEGDHCSIENLWNTCCISIHSLRMEGDIMPVVKREVK